MTDNPTRLYGISTGDGNDGVCHMFPRYYVRTDKPWELARRAAYSEFKPVAYPFLDDNLEIDGDENHTISAMLYRLPRHRDLTPHDEGECVCPVCEGKNSDDCADCDGSGSYDDWAGEECGEYEFILEVFPVDEADVPTGPYDRPIYNSIDDALGEAAK